MQKRERKKNKHSIDLLKAKSCGHLSILILIYTFILFNCWQFFLLWPLWYNLSPDHVSTFIFCCLLRLFFLFLSLKWWIFFSWPFSHFMNTLIIQLIWLSNLYLVSQLCAQTPNPHSQLLLDIFIRKSSQHSYPFQDYSSSHIVSVVITL